MSIKTTKRELKELAERLGTVRLEYEGRMEEIKQALKDAIRYQDEATGLGEVAEYEDEREFWKAVGVLMGLEYALEIVGGKGWREVLKVEELE